jgi:hypothetical protein
MLKSDYCTVCRRVCILVINWLKSEKEALTMLCRHFTIHGLYSYGRSVHSLPCGEQRHTRIKNRVIDRSSELIHCGIGERPSADEFRREIRCRTRIYRAWFRKQMMSLKSRSFSDEPLLILRPWVFSSIILYHQNQSHLTVSYLYNDSVDPYSLYDICVLIMHTCAYEIWDLAYYCNTGTIL